MAHPLRIAIGSDHGGFDLKEDLKAYLTGLGHQVYDCGTSSREPVDYPRFAAAVAQRVASGEADFGVAVDGAGIGSAMTANKIAGVLAAACYSEALARNAREHNDANVLTLGAAHTDADTARRIVDVFLTARCTVERHRARVAMIRQLEQGREGLSAGDVERVAARVRQLLTQTSSPTAAPQLAAAQVAQLIDHTLLRPEATPADIAQLCEEARQYGFFSVCVNPAWVRQAAELLRGSTVKVCAVVGFPLGAQAPEMKALEARRALREGAHEIDMVINIGALKAGDDTLVLRDMRGVVEACRERRAVAKVILETALLTEEEKVRACQLAVRAGAHFVKTSTGFSSGGATVEDVALMHRTVAAAGLKVKASGGIRSFAEVVRMIAAGASRIGSSASVKIVAEARAQAGQDRG
jgi:deoxyribose-phosphate aldolase